MQRWLRGMTSATALRCRWHVPSGATRLYRLLPYHCRRRQYGQVGSAPAAADDTNNIFRKEKKYLGHSSSTSSAYPNWYTVRQDVGGRALNDVRYYAQLEDYPTLEDYESLPKDVVVRPPARSVIDRVLDSLRRKGLIVDSRELLKRKEGLAWRHTISYQTGTTLVNVSGEDLSADAAYTAAFMGLIYRLHTLGSLQQMLASVNDEHQESNSEAQSGLKSNAAAKLHIHNFAARMLQEPEVAIEESQGSEFKATVSIPTSKFFASAAASDAKQAEFEACAALKKVIEDAYAKEGDELDLRDSGYVNLDNASLILSLYEAGHPYGRVQKGKTAEADSDSDTWYTRRLDFDGSPLSDTFTMPTQSSANGLAALSAAVRLVKRNPELLEEFNATTRAGSNSLPKKILYSFASLNSDVVGVLEECTQAYRSTSDKEELEPYEHGYKPRIGPRRHSGTSYDDVVQSLAARNEELRDQLARDQDYPAFAAKLAARKELPVYEHQTSILAMIKNHDQSIVVGTTGSGKSTQIPQIILDDAIAEGRGALCNIICTQPRRIAAVALALTVCNEREKELGDIVGYSIGGDYVNRSSRGGSITYYTTEILASELERADQALPHDVSHILIDEVHERSTHVDRLLSLIKISFARRISKGLRIPKLVLMSATVESDLFEAYFEKVTQDGTRVRPPYLSIPGRRFNTQTRFFDDYEHEISAETTDGQKKMLTHSNGLPEHVPQLEPVQPTPIHWESAKEAPRSNPHGNVISTVVSTIVHLASTTSEGSILAFVPGAEDMLKVQEALRTQTQHDLSDQSRYELLLLHSANPLHLARAFDQEPSGSRRILLSTSIAESSLTFTDVQYVVDSGLTHIERYKEGAPLPVLEKERISRANVLQRAGRAGRVKQGHYYGAFTSQEMNAMDAFPLPQALSPSEVQKTYLRTGIHFPEVPATEVFQNFLTPVPQAQVEAAQQQLRNMGALTKSNEISTIGYFLYRTNFPPNLARVVLLGMVFGALDRAIIIASIMANRHSIFSDLRFHGGSGSGPEERRKRIQSFSRGSGSDVLAQLFAYEEFVKRYHSDPAYARLWAEHEGIGHQYLDEIRLRVDVTRNILFKAGFMGPGGLFGMNVDNDNLTLLKMLILAGDQINIAVHQRGPFFVTHRNLIVKPSTSSVALPGNLGDNKDWDDIHRGFLGSVYCYSQLFEGSGGRGTTYMHKLTPISPLMAALFNEVTVSPGRHNTLLINDWFPLKLSGDPNAANIFIEFKRIFTLSLQTAQQSVCQIWGTDKKKRLQRGLYKIILNAALELLKYEEGQAKRRLGDVPQLSLGPVPNKDPEEPDVPMDAIYARRDPPAQQILPNSAREQPAGSEQQNAPLTVVDNETTQTEQPDFDNSSNQVPDGFFNLPSEVH